MSMDAVLINPGDRRQTFQELGEDICGVEPPFWVVVMSAYLRAQGFAVAIIDSNAENLTPDETAARVRELDPVVAAVIVYGSQPSASTQNMTVAGRICHALQAGTDARVALGGLHPSALPRRTMEEEAVDYVLDGEGILTLEELLRLLSSGDGRHDRVGGLWWRDADGLICNSDRLPVIGDLDSVLPVAAWDLLPMPLYRAHNWHCFDDLDQRQPYGAIYTSLGCPFSCVFCCINAPFGKPAIRYRSPARVIEEIDVLVTRYGVRNLKIVDELFVLKEEHYMGIVDLISERGYDLNIWAYARVDTVKPALLERMKAAGINWLALGIESASSAVRDGAHKHMRTRDIGQVVRQIRDAGIRVIGNYVFGLPDDTAVTMRTTLDLALELNCEFANFYSAMAYPGSDLYDLAVGADWALPDEWHGYSQHAYETLPLPTRHLSARHVLQFRDDAFHEYFAAPTYLAMLKRRFGDRVRDHVQRITRTRLKRRLLEFS